VLRRRGGNFFFGENRPLDFPFVRARSADIAGDGCDGWRRPLYSRHDVDIRRLALCASRRLVRHFAGCSSGFD
jgi:hypothetical protein